MAFTNLFGLSKSSLSPDYGKDITMGMGLALPFENLTELGVGRSIIGGGNWD